MGMPTNNGDISTINTAVLTPIEDRNKQFLYARAVHANHMIQYHMNEILERQRVVDAYRFMADEGRELIPLESDMHRRDSVIIQHTMQMIDTNIHWHEQTFREIIMDLRKIRNGETPTKTSEETNETAMMCWEGHDESKQESKKQKTHTQDNETSGKANEMDDKTPTMPTRTTTMLKQLNKPVRELRLGADNDALTLATQENPAKKLVYITNMPECTLETRENVRDPSMNTNEEDDRKPSPVEKTDQITSNVQLNAYEESDREEDSKKAQEAKKNTWRMRKSIHMELESDDDMDEQMKNSSHVKAEGNIRVKKKIIHYYEFSSDKEEGKRADLKKDKKTQDGHENPEKNDEHDQALVSNEMTLSSIGKDIFIGDSAAASHMTNNRTGVSDLVPIRGSVMIRNGESISCTHKGKLDVICKHRIGSTTRQTWEVKIVPQLNHDLVSFTKAMKEGWLMNGRWKEGGLMIELFKQAKPSMKIDRMIPSGSSWLMGIKTQRLVGQVHTAIEPGKSVPIWKFHQMTGHTGEYLMKTTADYMGIKLTGKLDPCEACAEAKIRQANIPKKKEPQVPSRPGYRLFIDISSFKHESMGGKRHWLIVVDEFSDCSHSFFLKRKSDQIELLPAWMKELKAKYGIDIKYVRLDNRGENRVLQKECSKQNLGIIFEFTAPGTPQENSMVERKIHTLKGRSRAMMITAGFSQQDKRKFWCEVISTATKLDNIMVRRDRTKPPYTLFYNNEATYMKFLRSFGEMAVIAISGGKKMRSKLDTRGRTGIFVGYADDHASNVYRFINIETKQIILSRDIQWLNSFWKEYKKRRDKSKKLVDEFYTPEEDDQTQEESETDEPRENEIDEAKDSGDGNNTEEQKKLGIDIQMIGAREKELGRT